MNAILVDSNVLLDILTEDPLGGVEHLYDDHSQMHNNVDLQEARTALEKVNQGSAPEKLIRSAPCTEKSRLTLSLLALLVP